ncbi:MAG: glutathione S-transferase [Pseudomonadaceae bacterium]|nr:glutathione S-transferase [Pseudomonadaceae bacterium]
MSTMTLFHAPASPFVRKVRVLLHETGQQDRVALHEVQTSPVEPSPELLAGNPAGKIPALRLADGSLLHDSRVILDYLDAQHVGKPLIPAAGHARWRRLTLASLADAILDAAVLLRYETFLRPADKRWDLWEGAQREKIERSLAYFEHEALVEIDSRFDIAAIGLACALGYLDLRQPQLGWRERYPGLAAWFAEVERRPSMLASAPSR